MLRPYRILFVQILVIALSSMPIQASNAVNSPPYKVHTVKAGDTLSKIAFQYYGDFNKVVQIAKFNNITDTDGLRIGQKIKIPSPPASRAEKPAPLGEADLGSSKQTELRIPGEMHANPSARRLNPTTLVFIIILLVIMLLVVLIRWLRMEDVDQPQTLDADTYRSKRQNWNLR